MVKYKGKNYFTLIKKKYMERSLIKMKSRKAFTLAELIIVVMILAILATISFLSLQWYTRGARDSTRISDVQSIWKSLELTLWENWDIPEPDEKKAWEIEIEWIPWVKWKEWVFWEETYEKVQKLSWVPLDPISKTKYRYLRSLNWNYFYVETELENGKKYVQTNYTWQIAVNNQPTPQQPWTPQQPQQPTPQKKEPIAKLIEVNVWWTVDPSNGIQNKTELPTWTTYSWKTWTPTTTQEWETNVTILVKYPDNTTREIQTKVRVTLNCNWNQHKEWNTCVSNTKSCTVTNGNWTQNWNDWTKTWWACTVTTCNTWYTKVGNECKVLKANTPPKILEIYWDKELFAWDQINLEIRAKDDDNDPLTYRVEWLPSWLTLTWNRVTWTSTGYLRVELIFKVSDGKAEVQDKKVIKFKVRPKPKITWVTWETDKMKWEQLDLTINWVDDWWATLTYRVEWLPEWLKLVWNKITWTRNQLWTHPLKIIANNGKLDSDPINVEISFMWGMRLTYSWIVSWETLDLPYHTNVNIKSIDWWDGWVNWCPTKNIMTDYPSCTYSKAGNYNIRVIWRADWFWLVKKNLNWQYINNKISSITDWNDMWVTTLAYAFVGTRNFNQPLNDFDTSKIINMNGLFFNSSFNQPLNNWNVSNVKYMDSIFSFAYEFNQDINNWNVSNVENMAWMFALAKKFNQPLNNWNVSKVTNMSWMFDHALAFNQNINSWDVSKVTDMEIMFRSAEKFNQPLNNWNVSKVTNMHEMFYEAKAFNQNISNWNTKNVANCSGFANHIPAGYKPVKCK